MKKPYGEIDKDKALEIAKSMVEQLEQHGGKLSQPNAAGNIRKNFGREFVYTTGRNWRIHPDILEEFNKLVSVTYDKSFKIWRRNDKPEIDS